MQVNDTSKPNLVNLGKNTDSSNVSISGTQTFPVLKRQKVTTTAKNLCHQSQGHEAQLYSGERHIGSKGSIERLLMCFNLGRPMRGFSKDYGRSRYLLGWAGG